MSIPRIVHRIGLLLLTCVGVLGGVAAQDGSTPSDASAADVYVTTQDHINFRAGPGLNWEVISTLEPGLTLPAVGRTAASNWVQVLYQGQLGWLSTRWLVWSGEMIDLPVDGFFEEEEFVRQVGVAAMTTRETPIYSSQVVASDQVGTLPPETAVEVVGRLGYEPNEMFNVQILYEGQLYWIGAWNLNLEAGRYRSVLDVSYRFAYSRLVRQFIRDINTGESRLIRIEGIWRRLQRGEAVRCSSAPELVPPRQTSDADINAEPSFGSAAVALDNAIGSTNTAIALFTDACTRADAFITQQDVQTALEEIGNAQRNYNIARSLVLSLERRDPVLGDTE